MEKNKRKKSSRTAKKKKQKTKKIQLKSMHSLEYLIILFINIIISVHYCPKWITKKSKIRTQEGK